MRIQLSRPPWAGGDIAARFDYDPHVLVAVKRLPGRKWHDQHHAWTFPATPENVRVLEAMGPSYGYVVVMDDDVRSYIARETAALSRAAMLKRGTEMGSSLPVQYVTAPYAHQRAGVEWLAALGSGALLWEMGLGKTKTVIDYVEALSRTQSVKALVICPNTVKANWRREVVKHAGHADVCVPEGTLAARVTQLGSARYTVVNCEALSLDPLASAIVKWPWDVVIVDESTRFKEPTAKRTKALHKMQPRHRIILSGMPTPNGPQDAWAQFEWVARGTFGSWWSFQDRYLLKDYFGGIKGVKPGMEDDLRARIESRSFRVLKADALDLPPKVYEDRVVELGADQRRYYNAMKEDLRVVLADKTVNASTILTQLLRLAQITAGMVGEGTDYEWLPDNAKVRELDTLLHEDLAGKQVVVFGLYQRELEELAARYGQTRDRIIYGPTTPRAREESIDAFQRGDQRLLFVQSRTGGIGINLTAAQYAVYYTRGWSLEEYAQSQDRLHRIGQQGTVTIVHLVAAKTIDEQIAHALADKSHMAALLTGDRARQLVADVLGGK